MRQATGKKEWSIQGMSTIREKLKRYCNRCFNFDILSTHHVIYRKDLSHKDRSFSLLYQAKNIRVKRGSKVFSVTASTSFRSTHSSERNIQIVLVLRTKVVSHVDTCHHPDGGGISYMPYDLNICVFDVHALRLLSAERHD